MSKRCWIEYCCAEEELAPTPVPSEDQWQVRVGQWPSANKSGDRHGDARGQLTCVVDRVLMHPPGLRIRIDEVHDAAQAPVIAFGHTSTGLFESSDWDYAVFEIGAALP